MLGKEAMRSVTGGPLKLATRILTSHYRPSKEPAKTVAIVVPISNRPALTNDEKTSLNQLRHYLGDYDKFLIAPRGLDFELSDFETLRFSRRFFGSPRANGRLLYRPDFYKRFQDYKYILVYHLDALVFADDLMQWCATDIDYIGAPWIPFEEAPAWVTRHLLRGNGETSQVLPKGGNAWAIEPRVGNGGLALMKVESVLTVLRERYRTKPLDFFKEETANFVDEIRSSTLLRRLTGFSFLDRPLEDTEWLKRIDQNFPSNDQFWSFFATKYMPSFQIADWKTGLQFAFETAPRQCFELNQHKLPFGCHAWAKYDRDFWAEFLVGEVRGDNRNE
jgi:hypothetical protein